MRGSSQSNSNTSLSAVRDMRTSVDTVALIGFEGSVENGRSLTAAESPTASLSLHSFSFSCDSQ